MNIGVLNESTLHRQLKERFAPSGSTTETKVGKYTCDIVCSDGKIIEIQTSSLSSIRNKLSILVETNKVEVVFPIAVNNFITMYVPNEENIVYHNDLSEFTKLYTRKSPKHNNFFYLFKELTGCYFLFDGKNISLRVVYAEVETIKVDDKMGKSRYQKPRIVDKKLILIQGEEVYNTLSEITNKVLSIIPDTFTSKEVKELTDSRYVGYVLWVLKKVNAIEVLKRDGRSIIYKKIS